MLLLVLMLVMKIVDMFEGGGRMVGGGLRPGLSSLVAFCVRACVDGDLKG